MCSFRLAHRAERHDSLADRGVAGVVLAVCLLQPCRADARPESGRQTVGGTDGVIHGTVTDSTGTSMPDVVVELSSGALIGDGGTREALTTATGVYRFTVLPPGDYALEFRRPGFASVRRTGVHVAIGFTARVDVSLAIAALQDHVTVRSGPVVDASSASITVGFDAHTLANLPSSRSLFGLLAATPAVHVQRFEVGGNRAYAAAGFSAYGTAGRNQPTIEGINVTGILTVGFPVDYGSFEEVAVATAAQGVEWDTPGVHMKIVVKSGGNQYHGTFYADYENQDWQAFNIDARQIQLGVHGGGGLSARETNRLSSYRDVNADVGGYLKRDRIWWYFSLRDQDVAARQVNFSDEPFRARLTSYTAKGTVRLTRNHTIVGFGQVGRNHQPYVLDPGAIYDSVEATADQRGRGWIWKGAWNATLRNSIVLEVRAGAFGARTPQTPNGTSPRVEDITTGIVRGAALDWQGELQRNQLLGSLSVVRESKVGTHEIHAGGRIFHTVSGSRTRGFPGEVLHLLDNEVPIEVYLFQTPSEEASGLQDYAAYADDLWRVNGRLTLDLGLRFRRSRVFLPAQTQPAGRFTPRREAFPEVANLIDWNTIAPRLALIWDPSGQGKTVAKIGYNGYRDAPSRTFAFDLNPNANSRVDAYTWTDSNGSGVWEPGEEGDLIDSSGGIATSALDPRLRLPALKEVTAWLEHELLSGMGISTGIVWRTERDHYTSYDVNRPFETFTQAIDIPDPGVDGRIGTADDGSNIRIYQPAPDVAELPVVNTIRNVASDIRYVTWEISTTRRFNGRWSLVAAFDHTWNRDQSDSYFGQPVRENTFPLTPNDLIHTAPNGQHRFTTWNAKVYGTYVVPWRISITPFLRHQSGQPFGRTFSAESDDYVLRILAEPVGTRRMDHVTLLDVRVEKSVHLGNARRAAVFLDVYNLLNANPVQNSNWSSGPFFLRPLSIVAPRIARIGAKLDW